MGTLVKYLKVLSTRKVMIVASVVLALSLAAAASLFLPNIYESKVVLQIFILQPRMPASAAAK